MSYDISIEYRAPSEGMPKRVPLKHHPVEQFKDLGEAYLPVPYSYEPAFVRAFDNEQGLRSINGMPVIQSLRILDKAYGLVVAAEDDFDNPWVPEKDKVLRVLLTLKDLAMRTIEEHPNADMMWSIA